MEFVKVTDTEITITLTIPEAIITEEALKSYLGKQKPMDIFGRLDRQAGFRVQHALDAVLDEPVRI